MVFSSDSLAFAIVDACRFWGVLADVAPESLGVVDAGFWVKKLDMLACFRLRDGEGADCWDELGAILMRRCSQQMRLIICTPVMRSGACRKGPTTRIERAGFPTRVNGILSKHSNFDVTSTSRPQASILALGSNT